MSDLRESASLTRRGRGGPRDADWVECKVDDLYIMMPAQHHGPRIWFG